MKWSIISLLVALLVLPVSVSAVVVQFDQVNRTSAITAIDIDNNGNITLVGNNSGMVLGYSVNGSIRWEQQLFGGRVTKIVFSTSSSNGMFVASTEGGFVYYCSAFNGGSVYGVYDAGNVSRFDSGSGKQGNWTDIDITDDGTKWLVLGRYKAEIKDSSNSTIGIRYANQSGSAGYYTSGAIDPDGAFAILTNSAASSAEQVLIANTTTPATWYQGYLYRVSHVVSSSEGSVRMWPVNITIYNTSGTSGNSTIYLGQNVTLNNWYDVRFTNATVGNLLQQEKVQEWSNRVVYRVFVPVIHQGENHIIYMYYGNISADLYSNSTVPVSSSTATTPFVSTYSTIGVDTWTTPPGVTSVNYLVVGGGGGGGGIGAATGAGGGGAGGFLAGTFTSTPWTVYNVTVGAGGYGGADTGFTGGSGYNSSFANSTAGNGFNSKGGGGGGAGTSGANMTGLSGGSGGGAAYSGSAGSGVSGQGYAGGTASVASHSGGGGGGASEVGQNGPASGGGYGGDGKTSYITGAYVTYAGGGGGGDYTESGGAGGAGGGGAGGGASSGTAGTDGLGGGGGGSGGDSGSDPYIGGRGGSGIVIVNCTNGTVIQGSWGSVETRNDMPHNSGHTYSGTFSSMDLPWNSPLYLAVQTSTYMYVVPVSSSGFGSAASVSDTGTNPYSVRIADNGAYLIEGRGYNANIFTQAASLDGTLAAVTYQSMTAVDINALSGLWAVCCDEGSYAYILTKSGVSAWYDYYDEYEAYAAPPHSPCHAAAISPEGYYAAVGRDDGDMVIYYLLGTTPTTTTPTPTTWNQEAYFYKNGVPYTGASVAVYESTVYPYTWTLKYTLETDGSGRISFYVGNEGYYYRFIIGSECDEIRVTSSTHSAFTISIKESMLDYVYSVNATESGPGRIAYNFTSLLGTADYVNVTILYASTGSVATTANYSSISSKSVVINTNSSHEYGIGTHYRVVSRIYYPGDTSPRMDSKMVMNSTVMPSFPIPALDTYQKNALFIILLMIIGGLFSYSNAHRGAIIFVLFAVVLRLLNLITIEWGVIVLAGGLAFLYAFVRGSRMP